MKLSANGMAVAAFLVLIGISSPTAAEAAQASSQSIQVLPPGGAQCAVLPVLGVVPYFQDGELQSFDVVYADPSYVALLASVGEASVPFNYMSRWGNPDGSIKTHVDIDSTPIHGSLPITLTLLSSPVGQPTCLTTISFSVTGGSAPQTTGGSSQQKPVESGAVQGGEVTPSVKPATTSTSTLPAVGNMVRQNLERACAASGPFQLWFVLLALLAVIVTLAAIAQPPLSERSPALPFVAILTPTVLLLVFWYFAPLCRAANWIPVVIMIGALLGLLVALRERQDLMRVIQLPSSPKPEAPSKSLVPVQSEGKKADTAQKKA